MIMDLDLIKEKLVTYCKKMESENIALLGFAFMSISMLIGLLIPKKLKRGLRLSCISVTFVSLATLALSILRWERESADEKEKNF